MLIQHCAATAGGRPPHDLAVMVGESHLTVVCFTKVSSLPCTSVTVPPLSFKRLPINTNCLSKN
jgi:hypothetical protein